MAVLNITCRWLVLVAYCYYRIGYKALIFIIKKKKKKKKNEQRVYIHSDNGEGAGDGKCWEIYISFVLLWWIFYTEGHNNNIILKCLWSTDRGSVCRYILRIITIMVQKLWDVRAGMYSGSLTCTPYIYYNNYYDTAHKHQLLLSYSKEIPPHWRSIPLKRSKRCSGRLRVAIKGQCGRGVITTQK